MKIVKTYESFMSDYQMAAKDFHQAKIKFENEKIDIWKRYSDTLFDIFIHLENWENNFLKMFHSNTGGYYKNYSEWLEWLFTKHDGDILFYNDKLKKNPFYFECLNEEEMSNFIDSVFEIMNLFGQLHDSFTLNLNISWDTKLYRGYYKGRGTTPTIPSEGFEEFIIVNLRKESLEEFKKSLIEQIKELKSYKSTIIPPPEWGLYANFYLNL
jgi:hypothetical protein